MKKLLKLNSFWLRIIALLTMTIDHIGACLDFRVFFIFRLIGRIALPLFVFMIVEGVLHTKNFKKYALRLGIMAALISLVFIIMEYTSLRSSSYGLLRA